MCILDGKSNSSYNKAAWPQRCSGGWSPKTPAWSMTSAMGANHGGLWPIKSAPLSTATGAKAASDRRFHDRLTALCPPRPPMPLIKRERMRPTAGERFVRALATLIAAWGEEEGADLPFIHRMELLAEVDWSSATFVGVRARIMLSYAPVSAAAAARLSNGLTAADYRIGAHLVADLTTEARHGGMMVEALLLEVH